MNQVIRIVLADDHSVLRAGLRSFFEEQKAPQFKCVGEAANGEEALKIIEEQRPDLVLLDLSMPGLGGLETVVELKRQNIPVKILVLTQFSDAIYVRRLLEAGANGYILKSARGDELISAISSIMSGGTYIDPNVAGVMVHARAEKTDSSDDAEAAFSRLTRREKQILKLVAEGQSNKEIASSLDLALKTVMAHRMNLMEKLNIHNQAKLIQFAIRVGLIQMP